MQETTQNPKTKKFDLTAFRFVAAEIVSDIVDFDIMSTIMDKNIHGGNWYEE